MKKLLWKALVTTALVAGCDSSGLVNTPDGLGDSTAATADTLQVDVRLRATGTHDFSSLQLLADDVQVLSDGVRLPVTVTGEPVELTREDQAWKIGTVRVPRDAKRLEFAVRLAPSGVFDRGQGAGWLDARSTVLRFASTLDNVATKHKAVLVLDAARSLVDRDADTVALVPHFKVEY